MKQSSWIIAVFLYWYWCLSTLNPYTKPAEMKYMRRTAGYTWTDHKTNTQIAKELKITPILDKLQEYKRNLIHNVNRMPRNRLPRVMKQYSPTGRRNHGRPLKRLLDAWDWNGSTSGPTAWQIDDDDEAIYAMQLSNKIQRVTELKAEGFWNFIFVTDLCGMWSTVN